MEQFILYTRRPLYRTRTLHSSRESAIAHFLELVNTMHVPPTDKTPTREDIIAAVRMLKINSELCDEEMRTRFFTDVRDMTTFDFKGVRKPLKKFMERI